MTKIEHALEIYKELFDLANSYAGNETGCVAVKLHEACNSILEANDLLKMITGDVVKQVDSGRYKLYFDKDWCGWYERKDLRLLKSA